MLLLSSFSFFLLKSPSFRWQVLRSRLLPSFSRCFFVHLGDSSFPPHNTWDLFLYSELGAFLCMLCFLWEFALALPHVYGMLPGLYHKPHSFQAAFSSVLRVCHLHVTCSPISLPIVLCQHPLPPTHPPRCPNTGASESQEPPNRWAPLLNPHFCESPNSSVEEREITCLTSYYSEMLKSVFRAQRERCSTNTLYLKLKSGVSGMQSLRNGI